MRPLLDEEMTLSELDREECLRLVAAGTVGRVVAVRPMGRTPVIRPVNYGFDQASQSVVFRCIAGTKFGTLMRATHAWFEIDAIDRERRAGWSVIVSGVSELVTSAAEARRLDAMGVDSWIAAERSEWIRIRAGVVTGRRLSA